MVILVERTGGIAEIALAILCSLLACLPIPSLLRPYPTPRMNRIVWFFCTLISWVCYSLVFYVIGVSFSPQPSREGFRHDRSSSLACSALLLVGLANSIVCSSIPDRYQNLCASYQQVAQMVFVLVLILSPWSIVPRVPFGSLLAALFLLWAAQQRSRSLSASARSRTKDDLLISEYMAKSRNDDQELSLCDLTNSCNYIVGGEVAGTAWWVLLLHVFLNHLTNFGTEVRQRGAKRIPDLIGAFFHDLQHASTPGAMASPVIRYDTLVTVQDIWKHIPPPPGGSVFRFPGSRSGGSVGRKTLDGMDLCLSFALFKLLRGRFRGCNLHYSGLGKSREFALQHLLSDPRIDVSHPDPPSPPSSLQKASSSSPRSFKIIDAELGFLFDFFYGNHLADSYCLLSTIGFIVWTLSLSMVYFDKFRDQHRTHDIHEFATSPYIFFMFPLLGTWQLYQSLAHSQKINLLVYICRRLKRSSLSQGRTFGGVLYRTLALGLLMLLPSSNTRPHRAKQYCLFFHGDSPRATTRGIPIKAMEAVVNALLDALHHRDGVLSDGQSSLSRNEVHAQLSWACRQQYVAEKIIVWHIATTLCHVEYDVQSTGNLFLRGLSDVLARSVKKRNMLVRTLFPLRTKPRASEGNQIDENHEATKKENHEVATILSGYCAYLVGFAPELIADDVYATRLVFDNARTAALERVKGEGSLARMLESAKNMTFGSSGIDSAAAAKRDVIFQGQILAAQLIVLEENDRWRVLAGVWAELMLFISPADNAAAHLEKLKTGGELITHIWALLTHAGILTRPTKQLLDPVDFEDFV